MHLEGVEHACFIDSWKHEWAFYPRQGSDLNFGSNDSPLFGEWKVIYTIMIFGAIDQIELWATRVSD